MHASFYVLQHLNHEKSVSYLHIECKIKSDSNLWRLRRLLISSQASPISAAAYALRNQACNQPKAKEEYTSEGMTPDEMGQKSQMT